MSKTYRVNEIFYSLQGEGVRQGTANIFIRFSACNLKCAADDPLSGFDCDTEFTSGINFSLEEVAQRVSDCMPLLYPDPVAIIFTGGEPALQLDQEMIDFFKARWPRMHLAIETNGTKELPKGLDWICVSPKSADHTIRVKGCDEIKYVRHAGQGLPKPPIPAVHKLISPAFNSDGSLSRENLDHCIKLVRENPDWRLSIQLHKILYRVR